MTGRRGITVERRFELKVGLRGDCFEWRGHRDHAGYGIFTIQGAPMRAHRVAFTLAKGALPSHKVVHHICRHRWCVRPSHLVAMDPDVHALEEHGSSGRCRKGHELTSANVYVSGGRRQCRRCHQEADQRRRGR